MAIVIPRIRVNLSKLQINSLYIEERGGLHMPLKSDFPVNSYWLTIHDKKKRPITVRRVLQANGKVLRHDIYEN